MLITEKTKLILLLAAEPNSLGAAMHNAAYRALGLNFVYIPISTDDIENAIKGIRGFNLIGSSVSTPHKQAVMQYIDKVDPVAEKIGAVNTIHNENGVLTGYNSDWIGAMVALKEVTEVSGKKSVVIGAGGAARAIAYGLIREGAAVSVFNRDVDKAQEFADSLKADFGGPLKNLSQLKDYDIVINATSVGSGGDKHSVVEKSFFKPGTVAMDVITVPAETTFLKDAQAKGAKTVPGYRMLIHQALFQVEKFSGQKAPFEIMEQALLEAIENI